VGDERQPPGEGEDGVEALREAGWSRTIEGVMPWMPMLKPSNSSAPAGGRINQAAVSTIRPSMTRARPTAQGLPRRALAVSKSMAQKASPSVRPSLPCWVARG